MATSKKTPPKKPKKKQVKPLSHQHNLQIESVGREAAGVFSPGRPPWALDGKAGADAAGEESCGSCVAVGGVGLD
jgi:hypothetical protein